MRFLVVGEVCQDVFIYGKCERLSPEAPVPVFQPISQTKNRGMAGNVADNLRSIININTEPFVCDEWLSIDGIIKTRYVDKKSNHIFLRVDIDEMVTPFVFTQSFANLSLQADVIIVSDYGKGFLSKQDLLDIADSPAICMLDSKKKLDKDILEAYDFVKLNEYEANSSAEIIKDYPEKVIITMGSKGTLYNTNTYPVEEVETIDVSGAGDTFMAALAFVYCKTKNIVSAILYANQMASRVVRKRGVSIV